MRKDKTYTFTENKLSPKHIKVKHSELAARGTIDKEFQQKIKNNIVKFIVDKNIMSDEADFIIQKLVKHSPRTFNVDYAINFNKFSDADASCDLSGVDVSTAIEEFVDLLEIENKSDIVEYTLDLYKKCK